jgi:hypothetical protein
MLGKRTERNRKEEATSISFIIEKATVVYGGLFLGRSSRNSLIVMCHTAFPYPAPFIMDTTRLPDKE